MKRTPTIAALALAALVVAGCKAKLGGSCKSEGSESCLDDKSALVCHDGKWEAMLCRGQTGCAKGDSAHPCDQTVAEDKDVCNLTSDFVCSGDKKSMLECQKNHQWALVQGCNGDRGCILDQRRVTCDNSVANVGDACREEDDYACTSDKKSALVCRSGKFVQTSLCKGPKGCRVTGERNLGFKVECDDTLANVGDGCEKEEHYSCSSDERAILKCTKKRFEIEERCKDKQKCQVRERQAGCY